MPFLYKKTLKLTGSFCNKPTVSFVKRELKDVQSQNKMFRIQIAWASEHNIIMNDLKQFVSNTLPRAIALPDGLPYKSETSKILQVYKTRYPEAFCNSIDITGFDCIVLDAMFFIYSPPLRSFNTFSEYIKHLYVRNISCYFDSGIQNVHVVFDDQSLSLISPKDVERSRRDIDDDQRPVVKNINLESESVLPSDWQKFLKIRENKKSLVNLVCEEFLNIGKEELTDGQHLVISGGFAANGIAKSVSNKMVSLSILFNSNIQEGDSRVWLHAFSCTGDKVLIFSPDNDTYHIGLVLLDKHPNKSVFVAVDSQIETVIDMKKMASLMSSDLDFVNVKHNITALIQLLYISSGCDYVSFFKGHGKKSFFDTFVKNVDFISKDQRPFTGRLSQIKSEWEMGFLAFLRLLGLSILRIVQWNSKLNTLI